MAGMSMEKYVALEHPYPTIIDKIDKFGYDPKQLHHIIRINEFIRRYINDEPYKDCLISKNKKYLIDVKKGILSLENARELALKYNVSTRNVKNRYMANNPVIVDVEVEKLLNDVLVNIMKKNFITEIIGE
jgi:hypothetical protein